VLRVVHIKHCDYKLHARDFPMKMVRWLFCIFLVSCIQYSGTQITLTNHELLGMK